MMFSPNCKIDLYLGGDGGGILSIVDSIKTLTSYIKKSGVTPCWLVQRCMVCFSLPDKPNLLSFHPHPQCDCMSNRGNKYILTDFFMQGIAPCYVELMSTSNCRSKLMDPHALWATPWEQHTLKVPQGSCQKDTIN